MNIELSPENSVTTVVSRFVAHAQGYHLRCSGCNAVSVAYAARDSLRIICPACERRLTLPATVNVQCPACRKVNAYSHHLAGHSANCLDCGRVLTLKPLIARAESRRRIHRGQIHHRRSSRGRGQRTLAFADGAERSLFILAAAVGTLIFLIVTSL